MANFSSFLPSIPSDTVLSENQSIYCKDYLTPVTELINKYSVEAINPETETIIYIMDLTSSTC